MNEDQLKEVAEIRERLMNLFLPFIENKTIKIATASLIQNLDMLVAHCPKRVKLSEDKLLSIASDMTKHLKDV